MSGYVSVDYIKGDFLAEDRRKLFFDQFSTMAMVNFRRGLATIIGRTAGALAGINTLLKKAIVIIKNSAFKGLSEVHQGIIQGMKQLDEIAKLNLDPVARTQV